MARRTIWPPLLLILVATVAGTSAAVAPISVSQLPNDPVSACSTPAVRAAFATCRLAGSSPACCAGLDAVFANSSSPSAWCLCIPQVLYKSISLASESGLDVLGTLHKCRKAVPGFETQWAAAQPTTCPHLTFGLNPAELVMQLGPDIVLASAKGRPAWAFTNVLQFGAIMQEVPDLELIWNEVLASRFAKFMFLVIILMPPLFLVAHHGLLMPLSAEYRRLPAGERLVVCEHAVYMFVFGVSLIPQTVLAMSAMFKAWTGWYLDSAQVAALLGIFIASRAVLYVIEAGVRSVVKWSWLLIVHHQLFFLIVLLAMWGQNAAVAGLGVVLDLFACHEMPLYLALVSYRLRWPLRFTQAVLRGAMAWYVLTRIFQTVVLIVMIAGFAGMSAVKHTPAFIVVAILCAVLTLIQAYTLVIYATMDRKVTAALRAEQQHGGHMPKEPAPLKLTRTAPSTVNAMAGLSSGESASPSSSGSPVSPHIAVVLSPPSPGTRRVGGRMPRSHAVSVSLE